MKAIRALYLQCQKSLALSGMKDRNTRQHQGGLSTPWVAKPEILNMRGYLWGIGEPEFLIVVQAGIAISRMLPPYIWCNNLLPCTDDHVS